jgi:polyphenol oxidase
MWRIEHTPLGRIVVPPALPDGAAVFCTSVDFEGLLTESAIDAVARLLCARFGFEGTLATCGQVHGMTVATAPRSEATWTETPDCDALVSLDGHVALAIKVADCLPISILDTEHGKVANIHSGWRGAAARVVPAAVERMSALHGTKPSSVRAWLGPSIRTCCFEVGEEVVDALRLAYGDVDRWVDRSSGSRPHVDLSGLTTGVLTAAGVPPGLIDDCGLCTRCDGSIFHSFRRDGKRAGRNLMVIAQAS